MSILAALAPGAPLCLPRLRGQGAQTGALGWLTSSLHMFCWPAWYSERIWIHFQHLEFGEFHIFRKGQTGNSAHFCCLVAKLRLTLCDPIDCSPPGSSVHGIFQVRILQWVAISYSMLSSGPRSQTHISCISCLCRQILYHCATWEGFCISEPIINNLLPRK